MSEEQLQKTESAKRKKPMALAGIVLLLLVAGVAVRAMIHRPTVAAEPDPAPVKPKAILHLESFVVNLADRNEKSFLRIGIDLGIAKEVSKKEGGAAAENTPAVRDAVISVLTAYRADDLLTIEGKQELKKNLLKSLDDRVPEMQVREIYFTEFLVQR